MRRGRAARRVRRQGDWHEPHAADGQGRALYRRPVRRLDDGRVAGFAADPERRPDHVLQDDDMGRPVARRDRLGVYRRRGPRISRMAPPNVASGLRVRVASTSRTACTSSSCSVRRWTIRTRCSDGYRSRSKSAVPRSCRPDGRSFEPAHDVATAHATYPDRADRCRVARRDAPSTIGSATEPLPMGLFRALWYTSELMLCAGARQFKFDAPPFPRAHGRPSGISRPDQRIKKQCRTRHKP